MTKTTMISLRMTIEALNVAVWRIPRTRMIVTRAVMTIAGRSIQLPLALILPVAVLSLNGAQPMILGI